MIVRPIRNESDYQDHLARIEALLDSAPRSPEADELEVLATLVDRFEEERFPIDAPTPVEAIRFRMEQQNLEPRDLEPYLGSRSRVSEVLSGSRSLSIDMIRALNQHLGIPAEVLIRADPLPASKVTAQLSKAAEKQLLAWGVLRTREKFESLLSRAFGDGPTLAMLRKTRTTRTNAKTDAVALQAWCAAALLKSHDMKIAGCFDPSLIQMDTVRTLAKLSSRPDGPLLARKMLSDLGIALLILPHLPGTHLDGAAMRRSDNVPVIALTLRRDRIDNFWFTLLHELAHVSRHLDGEHSMILDDLEISSSEDIEKEADDLAEMALIPLDDWATMKKGKFTSLSDVQALAERAGVNVAIVAGRWQQQNRDYRKFAKLLGHGTVRELFPEYVT